jgi:hypothetical protein
MTDSLAELLHQAWRVIDAALTFGSGVTGLVLFCAFWLWVLDVFRKWWNR